MRHKCEKAVLELFGVLTNIALIHLCPRELHLIDEQEFSCMQHALEESASFVIPCTPSIWILTFDTSRSLDRCTRSRIPTEKTQGEKWSFLVDIFTLALFYSNMLESFFYDRVDVIEDGGEPMFIVRMAEVTCDQMWDTMLTNDSRNGKK